MSSDPFPQEDAFASLDADWVLRCQHVGAARTVAQWLLDAGVLEVRDVDLDLNELLDVLQTRGRAVGPDYSDRWLIVLLRYAAQGGDGDAALAARVVVQAMLPGARRRAWSYARGTVRFSEAAQAVVASLWEAVVTYPVARRPRRVAANIIMETVHLASRDIGRERPKDVELKPSHEITDTAPGPDAVAEQALLEDSAVRLGLISSAALGPVSTTGYELLDLLTWLIRAGKLSPEAARTVMQRVKDQELAGALRRPGARDDARTRKQYSRILQRLRVGGQDYTAQGDAPR